LVSVPAAAKLVSGKRVSEIKDAKSTLVSMFIGVSKMRLFIEIRKPFYLSFINDFLHGGIYEEENGVHRTGGKRKYFTSTS
jgi:hypothetical protein